MRPSREPRPPLRVCPTVRQVYAEPPHMVQRRPATARPAPAPRSSQHDGGQPAAGRVRKRLEAKFQKAVRAGDPEQIDSLRQKIRAAERKDSMRQVNPMTPNPNPVPLTLIPTPLTHNPDPDP